MEDAEFNADETVLVKQGRSWRKLQDLGPFLIVSLLICPFMKASSFERWIAPVFGISAATVWRASRPQSLVAYPKGLVLQQDGKRQLILKADVQAIERTVGGPYDGMITLRGAGRSTRLSFFDQRALATRLQEQFAQITIEAKAVEWYQGWAVSGLITATLMMWSLFYIEKFSGSLALWICFFLGILFLVVVIFKNLNRSLARTIS